MDFAEKLDMMDDDCDIEGFPIDKNKNTMTPLEAAEKLEITAKWLDDKEDFGCGQDAMRYAASFLRSIAAGEYKRVVHGHWTKQIFNAHSAGYSVCYYNHAECDVNPAGLMEAQYDICPFCGALMDGKDDSHEAD